MWTVKGKNAIVTGAGSGIGKELALELARRGANVAITDIVAGRLAPVKNELLSLGVKAEAYTVDQADEKAVAEFHGQYTATWGRADILCLNAGVAATGPVENLTLEYWKWNLGVNLWGPIYMVEKFVHQMIQNQGGGILITASVAGFMSFPGMSPYNTSKYGMMGFAETLHIELSKHNIHVCALCPGFINTNIVSDARMAFDKEGGGKVQDKAVKFYATYGADPARVAKDGLRGLAKNRCVQPSPYHAWLMYYFKRFLPGFYWRLTRLAWKKGWVV
ncbi:MAG: SDR family oxidoreductase [Proteobacteria bacterium]|nr:SDR family oxidoreductase [Pseudomonadota bacterium]